MAGNESSSQLEIQLPQKDGRPDLFVRQVRDSALPAAQVLSEQKRPPRDQSVPQVFIP